jgi:predicted dithiol-disulfide oxidoreductase (DUF899 family)
MVTLTTTNGTKEHKVVSPKEWLAARKRLLLQEKKFTRLRDQLNQQRRNLPWVRVDKEYLFDGPNGQGTLAGLFCGRSQLIVYHFMFAPGWKGGLSSLLVLGRPFRQRRYSPGPARHLLAVVSRAPLKKIEPFKTRMGWRFKWVSSFRNDFNFDYHVSFTPEQIRSGTLFYNYAKRRMDMSEREGVSAFYRDQSGGILHTYSSYARGIDLLNTTYNFLDLTAKGRDENLDRPQGWVRYHDKYKRSSHCGC